MNTFIITLILKIAIFVCAVALYVSWSRGRWTKKMLEVNRYYYHLSKHVQEDQFITEENRNMLVRLQKLYEDDFYKEIEDGISGKEIMSMYWKNKPCSMTKAVEIAREINKEPGDFEVHVKYQGKVRALVEIATTFIATVNAIPTKIGAIMVFILDIANVMSLLNLVHFDLVTIPRIVKKKIKDGSLYEDNIIFAYEN